MATERAVGSAVDAAFFEAVGEVFMRYPDLKTKYAVVSLALEAEMGIDFERQHGVSRVEGDRIVTEFVDRDRPIPRSVTAGIPARICLEEDAQGNCLEWWYY
ncbi:hypothetical protein ACFP3U_00595 [Kitasatospora misakiensis]|uniref:Uncharacterized protein n=1 Tax=Kitasatospora misakiensis TaxID=67330 RepID=A0ABW0WVE1_9ACTN